MAERFRDLMDERTGGRFRVVIYPSGQLGGERTAFEQIQAGAVQVAITGTPVLSGWVPETQVFDLPFLFETRDHGLRVMQGPAGTGGGTSSSSAPGPLARLPRLRIPPRLQPAGTRRGARRPRRPQAAGPPERDLSRGLLGARVQATPMNYGEVYSALQQGVIDGGEANAVGFVSSRLYEVAKFYSFTSITYNPITLLVNEPFYRSLPPDVRELVDRSARTRLRTRARSPAGWKRTPWRRCVRTAWKSPAPTWPHSRPPSARASGTSWPPGCRMARR